MKKSKIFLSIVGAISMLVAATSCDLIEGAKTSEILNDYINNGETLTFTYNSWKETVGGNEVTKGNYQAYIKLSDYLTGMGFPILEDKFSFDVQLLALDDMDGISEAVIVSRASVDAWWKKITDSKYDLLDEITKGSVYSFDEDFSVNLMNYATTDINDFYLVLKTDLREGESVDNHVASLETKAKIDVSFKKSRLTIVNDTVSAGYDYTKYTMGSSSDDYVYYYLEAGTYGLNWLDSYGYLENNEWKNNPMPQEWKDLLTSDTDSYNADFYLYKEDGTQVIRDDCTFNASFTISTTGVYKIKIQPYGGHSRVCHGIYHIYKQ